MDIFKGIFMSVVVLREYKRTMCKITNEGPIYALAPSRLSQENT